jgi:hypothetical protein
MSHLSRLALYAFVCLVPLFCWQTSVLAEDVCPVDPLGITERVDGEGKVFHATAFVRPLSDERASINDAKNDARIAARIILKKDPRVPRSKTGKLFGLIDKGSCEADGRVYASVSVSVKSAKQAIELDERIKQSLKQAPPTTESYSRIFDADEQPPRAPERRRALSDDLSKD